MSSGTTPEDDRRTCTACRGTGTVISGKGGEPHPLTCPWCGGSGVFAPGRDAQAGAVSPSASGAPGEG